MDAAAGQGRASTSNTARSRQARKRASIGSEPMSVSLSTPSAGAAVYYRTNADPAYQAVLGPLSLTAFTKLDTYAQLDGMEPSPFAATRFRAGGYADRPVRSGHRGELRVEGDERRSASNDVAADRAYYGNLQIPGAFDGVGRTRRKPEAAQAEGERIFQRSSRSRASLSW